MDSKVRLKLKVTVADLAVLEQLLSWNRRHPALSANAVLEWVCATRTALHSFLENVSNHNLDVTTF